MKSPALTKGNPSYRGRSALLTLLISCFFILACWFLTAVHLKLPLHEDKEQTYELGGTIDYGDWKEGSKDINSFAAATANPGPNPANSQATPVEKDEPDEKEDMTDDNEPEETPVVPVKPVKTEKKPDKPKEEPKEKPKEVSNAQGGGSNHGDKAGQIGNRGTPDSPVLDPNGLFEFGSGEDGLKGRKPIDTPLPKYKVQKQTKLAFEFTIAPDGKVVSVRPIKLGSSAELVNSAKTALLRWKFNKISGTKDQKCKVTFTFKLK